jgi:hypothetical protein
VVEISPVDKDGRVKSAEECFLEVFEESAEPEKVAAEDAVVPKWMDADAPSSWYAAQLIKKYDREWLEWEPETLWQTILQDFRYDLEDEQKDRINSAKNLFLTDSFWNDWVTFEKTVLSFNGTIPDFFQVQVPSVGQMAWAVQEAEMMRPGMPFSEEVGVYAGLVCKESGYVLFPDQLQFAQERPLGREAADIKSAWEIVKSAGDVKIIENELGVNLVRLQAVQAYVDERAQYRD